MFDDVITIAFYNPCPVPRDRGAGKLDMTKLGVRLEHEDGDRHLLLIRNEKTDEYALAWTRIEWSFDEEVQRMVQQGETVWSFDGRRTRPMALSGVKHVCAGSWLSRDTMLVKIRDVFDRCGPRGMYCP